MRFLGLYIMCCLCTFIFPSLVQGKKTNEIRSGEIWPDKMDDIFMQMGVDEFN